MAGKTLDLETFLTPDRLGVEIANKFQTWEDMRSEKVAEWREIQQYIFATDTTKTTNAKLEWSNKTTIPKLCQIRDNLIANYMASLFPKRKWLQWVGHRDRTPGRLECGRTAPEFTRFSEFDFSTLLGFSTGEFRPKKQANSG